MIREPGDTADKSGSARIAGGPRILGWRQASAAVPAIVPVIFRLQRRVPGRPEVAWTLLLAWVCARPNNKQPIRPLRGMAT
jgi:hypothetical protein